jgi:hypothetical protein
MTDTFADGTTSIIGVLRPKGGGWHEIPIQAGNPLLAMGHPVRGYFHPRSMIQVMSAVELASDAVCDGPEYHLSIIRSTPTGPARVDSNDARWVLDCFKFDGAREDNHVPHGRVRNFWRPVTGDWVGVRCHCEDEEPTIREDKGDFIWRGITP